MFVLTGLWTGMEAFDCGGGFVGSEGGREVDRLSRYEGFVLCLESGTSTRMKSKATMASAPEGEFQAAVAFASKSSSI
jgi:hypothetical protein